VTLEGPTRALDASCAGVLTGALRRKVADPARVTTRLVALSWGSRAPVWRSWSIVDRSRRTFERHPATPPSVTIHRLPSPRGPGSCQGRAPSESLASSRLADRLAVGSGSQRFPCPSTTSLARAPYAADLSGSATAPTPGFLTPSPVSWLRSSSRVCFAPQPSLGSALPSERSPRVRSRTPRRGRWLPCRSSRPALVRRSRSCHLRPSPTRATFGRRPWPDPAEARGSLSAPRGASRSPWTSHAGLTSARSFRRLRSVLPCASPFTPRVGLTRRAEAGALLGVPRPSRALLPPDLGPSFTRHGRRRPSSRWHRAPLGASRDPGDPHALGHFSWLAPRALRLLDTLDVRWTPRRDDRNVLRGSVGGHRAGPARAVPSFDGSLDSHDLRCVSEPTPVHRPATLIAWPQRTHQA
jgi:hypothetical protein